MADKDLESPGKIKQIPHWQQIYDRAGVTPEVENWHYEGSGTEDDPYVVGWIDNDPRNPMNYPQAKKWALTMLVAFATLAVAFVSSAYSGGAKEIIVQFEVSQEIYTLGLSLFVLGFAIGPLLWAPLSELFGRQPLFIGTYAALTAFNAGAAGSQNIQTLIILRFFAGAFGSSPLTNAGGVISDMFPAKQRGLAMALFAAAPFLGPVIGPIVGGFVGETIGWRWVEGIMAIFTGALWILGAFLLPETYPPVLQRARAAELSKRTGKIYRSAGDVHQGPTTFGVVFRTSLSRPWILLFREPIVAVVSLYMAIIYGTLYMMFGAFPAVYQQARGWSPGVGGLAFLGVAVGMMFAVTYAIFDNRRYSRISDEHKGFAPPEARLPVAMVGSVALPIGLFWFAWTNYPSIHWIVSIMGGGVFGFGIVLVFLSLMNYLIDAYVIYAASVLAANSVLRSLFGAAFPLFTTQMYDNLGLHWASSIPAFLALACVPCPFLFYRYGPAIRKRCTFASEADAFMKRLQNQNQDDDDDSADAATNGDSSDDLKEKDDEEARRIRRLEREGRREEEEQEAIDYSYEPEKQPGMEPIKTTQSRTPGLKRVQSYENGPFDLDRVNTRESFGRQGRDARSNRSRGSSRASGRSKN